MIAKRAAQVQYTGQYVRLTMLSLLLCICFLPGLQAQNLVPNGSFERYATCPDGTGQISLSTGWYAVGGSPDFCHACELRGEVSVPHNTWGVQPARTGQAYGHLILYYPQYSTWSGRSGEFMQTQLVAPLVAGVTYQVSFFVALSQRSSHAIDGVGVHFSTDTLSSVFYFLDPFPIPQIANPDGQVLSQVGEWVRISGNYTARGGEKFISIGNFKTDKSLTVQELRPNSPNPIATYFIDEVSVVACDPVFDIGPDKQLCPGESITLDAGEGFDSYLWQDGSKAPTLTVSAPGTYWVEVQNACTTLRDSLVISPNTRSRSLLLHPNPTAGRVAFARNSECHQGQTFSLRILNAIGQQVEPERYGLQLHDGADLSAHAAGMYLLVFTFPDRREIRKVMKLN